MGICFFSVVALVKILSDNKIRAKLIDQGKLDESIKYLYPPKMEAHVPSALKWGMVLIGVGLAFLAGQLVPPEFTGEVTVGSMFFFAGLGLVLYYFIARKAANRSEE